MSQEDKDKYKHYPKTKLFEVIDSIGTPHLYCIGTRHIACASDHWGEEY